MAYPATFGAGLFVVAEFPRTVRCSCCCVFCLFCSCFLGFLPIQENMIACSKRFASQIIYIQASSMSLAANRLTVFLCNTMFCQTVQISKKKEGEVLKVLKRGQVDKTEGQKEYPRSTSICEHTSVCACWSGCISFA